MMIDPPRSFKPGLYKAKIEFNNPITGVSRKFEQDFAWGVLALNTDQDVYIVGQTADIHIGVLDDRGDIVGDADVTLKVTAPDGMEETLQVPPTGTCGVKEIGFIEPDYRASYDFELAGEYRFQLTATHAGGTRSMTSAVRVVEDAGEVPFIVKWVSATRNYPAYFAEGYTGENFQEYLCLGQPSDQPLPVRVACLFNGTPPVEKIHTVPAHSRLTLDFNAEIGPDREVSIKCSADYPFVSERPMHFNYKGVWTGGHDSVGATLPARNWYFAEGYTGPGFEEWICVLNDTDNDANAIFYFQA